MEYVGDPWSRPLKQIGDVVYSPEVLKPRIITTLGPKDTMILDLVTQYCRTKDNLISSGFIAVAADAIRYLCEVGLLELISDSSPRDVVARSK